MVQINEQIKLLVELQKLDTSIIEKGASVRAIPSKLSALEKPHMEAASALETQRQEYQAAEKKKREKERGTDELNDKIAKLKARMGDIKDNKAYQAHLKEIEAAEKTRYAVEDEILSLMEAMEAEASALKRSEAALDAEKQKVAAIKKELDAEITQAEKELDVLKSKRKGFSAPLDPGIYDMYMSLLKSLRGLAVVEAKEEVVESRRIVICQGCNMNIMPQLFVEIRRNERIIQCPQCRRILYYGGAEEPQPSA